MEARISFPGYQEVSHLESLNDWLKGEHSLAGRVRLDGPAPRPGELGAPMDAVVIALGSGGALSVLASSLKTWLSQPRRSDIRIRIESDNGRNIEIDAKRIDQDQIETLLKQTLHPGE
ncbi:effector-associated constant component EACC1 [Microbispora amethystogenes]|uniref:Uncharacterized protein n=1 Tax=Microbispora amethystogenes TaxID=1427754 RepID=A0ABQ4FNE9_9ACTN|nr:hypothetical protein [Microbispora amethystogenes]GIH36287.1 hypothetical protein Mam01_64510 [Microbispora amethystogenes]